MGFGLTRVSAVLAGLAAILSMLTTPAAAVVIEPSVTASATHTRLGALVTITVGGMQPAAPYTLTASAGTLHAEGAATGGPRTLTLIGPVTGTTSFLFQMPTDSPGEQADLTLTAPGAPTILAAATLVADQAPTIAARACLGSEFSLSLIGLADGTYSVTVADGVWHLADGSVTSTITATVLYGAVSINGRQFLALSTTAKDLTVTLARADGSVQVLTQPLSHTIVTRLTPVSPWEFAVAFDCFQPGEWVTVRGATGTTSTAYTQAGPQGLINVGVTVRPGVQPVTPTLTLTGGSSKTTQTIALATITPPTAFYQGQQLGVQDSGGLLTAAPGYRFKVAAAGLIIEHFGTGTQTGAAPERVWTGPSCGGYRPGTLRLSGGNLALTQDSSGSTCWTSDTAGTAATRFLLQDNGIAVLQTSAGAPVWTSAAGRIRGAGGLVTYTAAASSRVRSAVYINGLSRQRTAGGALIPAAHRIAYLQRLSGGRWQNLLARSVDSRGESSVGFIQSRPFSYRWVVPATPGLMSAASAPTYR